MRLRFGNQVVDTIETTPNYDYQNIACSLKITSVIVTRICIVIDIPSVVPTLLTPQMRLQTKCILLSLVFFFMS